MRILLTTNKTYRGFLDGGYYHFFSALEELGHDVYFYDTVKPDEVSYSKVIESFKPDVIWSCLTGDANIAPYEPTREIKRETKRGRIKTFNWFCDDTWRFETFSKKVCNFFTCCSTPEPLYLEKYKQIGYDNILLGNWHINNKYIKRVDFEQKDIDISFIGNMTKQRKNFFDNVDIEVSNFFGLTNEQLFNTHGRTKIGINLSRNDNDPLRKTQMKQRIFEIAASGGLVVTEYHKGIEEFFTIDKEIITFETVDEFNKKVIFLLKNPKLTEKIANNGYKRFCKEHESKIRLSKILTKIVEI